MLKETLYTTLLSVFSEEELSSWFMPLHFTYEKNILTVTFPHMYFPDWFKANWMDRFELAIFKNLENLESINYTLHGRDGKKTIAIKDKVYLQEHLDQVNAEKDFNSFIFNRKNQYPVAVAKDFAALKTTGIVAFYAGNGMGKTHLLSSIYNELLQNVQKKYIFFSSLNALRTAFYDNPEDYLKANIIKKYKVVIIDNLHECSEETQLHSFLALLLENCIVHHIPCAISMLTQPAAFKISNGKIKSMLSAALPVEIKKPDLDIKNRYAMRTAREFDVPLKKDEALQLAQSYTELRQIRGILKKYSSYREHFPGDKEMDLQKVMARTQLTNNAHLTPDYIIEKTANYFSLQVTAIKGKTRGKTIVEARQIAMYLCRELLDISLSLIGSFFEGKNHSSVLYSYNKISYLTKTNKDKNILVTNIKNLCLK